MEHRVWQVLRRHLLAITWPPTLPVDEVELTKRADAAKASTDGSYPTLLLDLAEAARWRGDEARVGVIIQSASPLLNTLSPTDATVADIIRIAVLYEFIGKHEEATISLTRASKTLAKLVPAITSLALLIDVAGLILLVKQDSFSELRVKQMSIFGALSKLSEAPAAAFVNAAVGDFYLTLGKVAEAESLYTQGLKVLTKTAPADPAVGDITVSLATVQLSRGKFTDASKTLASLPSTSSPSVSHWASVVLAKVLHAQGRFGESQEHIDKAVAALRGGSDASSFSTSAAVIDAVSLAVQRGDLLKADELIASVAALRQQAISHPLSISYALALVSLRMRQGVIKDAEAVLVEKLTAQKNRKGSAAEFLVVAPLLHSLASVYVDSGRAEDADGLITDALAIRRKVFGEDHIALLPDLQLHARILHMCGHDPAADALWKRVLAIATKASHNAPSLLLGTVHTALGQTLAQRGSDKAEASLREGHSVRVKAAGEGACAFVAESEVLLAEVHIAREQLNEAKEIARRAVATAKAAGAVELESAAFYSLSRALSVQEHTEREASAERAWALRRDRQGPAAPRTTEALLALVSAYDAHNKMEEATALLQFALRALKKERPEMDDPMMVHILHQLALHYWDMEQSEEAVALVTQSLDLCKRLFGPAHPLTAAVYDGAALIFDDAAMDGEAEDARQAANGIRQQLSAP